MKCLFYKVIFSIILISSSFQVFSQIDPDSINPEKKVIVKMTNDDEYIGEVLSQADNSLILKTENGEINLIVSNIKSIEEYTYSGKFRFPILIIRDIFLVPRPFRLKKDGDIIKIY